MSIRRSKILATVSVSSMADIAFLLLVFFMVTSVLKVDADIPLEYPDGKGQELKDKDINIFLAKDNRFYFNNVPMGLEDLQANVKAELQSKPEAKFLINAHNNLDFTRVHKLLAVLKTAGVKKFALVTKQENRQM